LGTHKAVEAFVKNAGLGFAIPYLHNGRPHDYQPDFIVRLDSGADLNLILETKGYDPLKEVEVQAAARWKAAVNADGRHGQWAYALAEKVGEISRILERPVSTSSR
jgi:type III restriction enzyme